ncbi:uncharacterized protein SOCEGT47_032270 [Sorangium cellulosum]|uniref:Uncharacterized protein n=1 Tax=Sorangium cellulosum TaxID=56 RepID=A0A4P2Q0Y1_SORCE|nr:uncharacterized protein SOCEGT47_032270 [Sorangium cellulosum]
MLSRHCPVLSRHGAIAGEEHRGKPGLSALLSLQAGVPLAIALGARLRARAVVASTRRSCCARARSARGRRREAATCSAR